MNASTSATFPAILLCAGLAGCTGLPNGSGANGEPEPIASGPSADIAGDATPFERRGAALRRAGRLDAAEASFRRALEIDAGSIAAREGLGLVLLQRDNLALAEVMLERVLELDEGRVGTLAALGVLRDRQGRHTEAQARFREALASDDDNAAVLNNLGFSLLLEGRLAEAESELERAVRIDPSLGIAWSNLALARARAGDRPGAREALSRVGGRQETLNNLAMLDLLAGDVRQAQAGLRASLASAPEYYAPARRNLALLEESPRARARVFERAGLGDIPSGRTTPVAPVAERAADSRATPSDDALLAGSAASDVGRSILLDANVEGGDADASGAAGVPEGVAPSGADDEGADTESEAGAAPDAPMDGLTRTIVRDVQRRLTDGGFDAGPVDGVVGRATRRAVRLFKAARGLPVDGFITPRLIEELER